MYHGYSSVALQELFEIDTIQTAKVQEVTLVNLKSLGAQGILRSSFFSNRVINGWNALDQSAVNAPSINAFKQTLVKVGVIFRL